MHFLSKCNLFNNKKGFTLVELLIVVVIIAVLSAVGMAVFGSQQPKSRDARRKADINAIADAMEANYDREEAPGQYVELSNGMFSSGIVPTDPLDGNSSGCHSAYCGYCFAESETTVPDRPTCSASNVVTQDSPNGGAKKYWVVCANLETPSGPDSANRYYFCRYNRQ